MSRELQKSLATAAPERELRAGERAAPRSPAITPLPLPPPAATSARETSAGEGRSNKIMVKKKTPPDPAGRSPPHAGARGGCGAPRHTAQRAAAAPHRGRYRQRLPQPGELKIAQRPPRAPSAPVGREGEEREERREQRKRSGPPAARLAGPAPPAHPMVQGLAVRGSRGGAEGSGRQPLAAPLTSAPRGGSAAASPLRSLPRAADEAGRAAEGRAVPSGPSACACAPEAGGG